MTAPILKAEGFAVAVLDAIPFQICVIDTRGVIVAVNRAWQNFTLDNPPVSDSAGVGSNYREICQTASGYGSEGAEEFGLGVQSVLDGQTELFQMEYPCHSPKENRWFIGRVTPLQISQIGAVISHTDITDRKLLEFELIKLAETDPLTGLPNRRSFLETANLEVERVTRYSVVASLITIDLDYFKAVNDTHGHAAGDAALFCFAQVCKKILRNIDTLARLGGDEFVVLLPRTNKSDAVNVAEKLRRAVATTPVESGQRQFNITASFGVAEVLAGDKGIAECLHRADSFLYAAKRAGHNCVMSVDVAPSRA